jgi:hypothetical protein
MLLVAGLEGASPDEARLLAQGLAHAGLVTGHALDVSNISELISASNGVPVGVFLGAQEADRMREVVDAGCDFVVLDRQVPAGTLEQDDVGKLLAVDSSFDYTLVRGINSLDVEAVLVDAVVQSSLTVEGVLLFRRFSSLLSKPVVARLAAPVSAGDVVALWKAGVDALVVPPGQDESVYAGLREAVDELPRGAREKRRRWDVVLPRQTGGGVDQAEEEEEEEEEEDADWDSV